jgi:hypothetical protein
MCRFYFSIAHNREGAQMREHKRESIEQCEITVIEHNFNALSLSVCLLLAGRMGTKASIEEEN